MTAVEPEMVTLPAEDLRAIFDLAVGSLDHGSGMWDIDDVEAAGRVATALGLDPFDAATSEFQQIWPHAFKEFRPDQCSYCNKPPAEQIHQERAEESP